MKRGRQRKTARVACILALLLIGRAAGDIRASLAENSHSISDWLWRTTAAGARSPALRDNPDIYADDSQLDSIRTLYLVILPTMDASGQSRTFTELNAIMDFRDAKPLLNAYFADDSGGPYPDAETALTARPNATVTLRGHSTVDNPKKSYKIHLNADTPAWQGQTVINLNKHVFDDSRMRNKIAFDLFRYIPGLTSMRLQFVHLYVKDLSGSADADSAASPDGDTARPDGTGLAAGADSADTAAAFVDYGLFTQIEQANRTFLRAHGLDTEGSLYKAEYFEFFRYPDLLRNTDDPAYSLTDFESRLEIRTAKNHKKLLQMLDDVNNPDRDIDGVLDRHFNRENYFSWLAVNILLGNNDTQTQNFFLYSPHDTLAWYFLPWDYDAGLDALPQFMYDTDGSLVQLVGISNYWNGVLHNRVFRKPHNVAELDAAVERVYRLLSDGSLGRAVDRYLPVVERYYLHGKSDEPYFKADNLYESVALLRGTLDANYRRYRETLEKPMPVYLGTVEQTAAGEQFSWTESFDLQGDRFSYTLQISSTPDFREPLFEKTRLTTNSYIYDLPPGDYFWRVRVIDAKGAVQRAFDTWYDENDDDGRHYYGLSPFTAE